MIKTTVLLTILTAASALPTSNKTRLASARVVKRTDPGFPSWTSEDADKLSDLKTGVRDAYVLAAFAQRLKKTFPDIWDNYFPSDVQDAALNVYQAILPDPDHTDEGGELLSLYQITPFDFLGEGTEEEDLCGRGAEAYTKNYNNPPGNRYALCHVCDSTYEADELFLTEQTCDDFKFANGRYRITQDMNALGATILHEFTHFEPIATLTGVPSMDLQGDPERDPNTGDSVMWDVDGPEDPGSPLAARRVLRDKPERAIQNADSYVWVALESYWTVRCSKELIDNNQGRFDNPVAVE